MDDSYKSSILPSAGKIIVVDDEKIICEGCVDILVEEGYDIKTVLSGNEALEHIKKECFDIMLLDLKMPGISGMEVLHHVKRHFPDMTVIIITGFATVESAVQAMKEGAYDYITKPFTPEEVRSVVRRALETKRLVAERELLRLERERSLKALSEEKSKLRMIVNCMAEGILVIDRENTIVLDNPASIKLLRLEEESVVGKPLRDVISDLELLTSVQKILSMDEDNIPTLSKELSLDGGKKITLMTHFTAARDEGKTVGAVIVLQDITKMKELNELKSEFVTIVSHQLRSPLSTVQEKIDIILSEMVGKVNDKQKWNLQRAREKTQVLLSLINDLLDIAQIEAGKIFKNVESINLYEALKNIIESYLPEAERQGVKIKLRFPDAPPEINADRENLDLIFGNLISNAIKFTPSGGSVSISVSKKDGKPRIDVADTGIGIAPEEIPKIFDKFYRVKNDQTRYILGTGLGLSIVKSLVETYGGEIKVKSQPGKGSTFTVIFPKEVIVNE